MQLRLLLFTNAVNETDGAVNDHLYDDASIFAELRAPAVQAQCPRGGRKVARR